MSSRAAIESIIREDYYPDYDPEKSLGANGFDSLEMAELSIQLERQLELPEELGKNDMSLDMTLDYIDKVISQKLT